MRSRSIPAAATSRDLARSGSYDYVAKRFLAAERRRLLPRVRYDAPRLRAPALSPEGKCRARPGQLEVPELEKKDDLKRRIDAAAKYIPLENLCLSPQCGFSNTTGNKLTADDQCASSVVLEVSKSVWG